MDEAVYLKYEGKNIDIKQEKQDNVDSYKYEFDSGSQDSSKSGSGGYQRWAPNLNGVRKKCIYALQICSVYSVDQLAAR